MCSNAYGVYASPCSFNGVPDSSFFDLFDRQLNTKKDLPHARLSEPGAPSKIKVWTSDDRVVFFFPSTMASYSLALFSTVHSKFFLHSDHLRWEKKKQRHTPLQLVLACATTIPSSTPAQTPRDPSPFVLPADSFWQRCLSPRAGGNAHKREKEKELAPRLTCERRLEEQFSNPTRPISQKRATWSLCEEQ